LVGEASGRTASAWILGRQVAKIEAGQNVLRIVSNGGLLY